MDKDELIAERELIFVAPDGSETLSSVQFSKPYFTDEHGCCCDWEIPNIEKRRFAAGVDGIQAILLSMLMVASHLDVKSEKGWKFLWPDDRSQSTVSELFSADQFKTLTE